MKLLKSRTFWVSIGIVITVLYAGLYVVIQQSLRLGANEPQASMAKTIAAQIQHSKSVSSVVLGRIDLRSDTAPFVIIYDQFGKVVRGNGFLDGDIPQAPIGVLSSAKGDKLNAVTWKPANDVRIASVSAQAGKQYVLVGRTLSVIDGKIKTVGYWIIGLWLLTLLAIATVWHKFFRPQVKPQPDDN